MVRAKQLHEHRWCCGTSPAPCCIFLTMSISRSYTSKKTPRPCHREAEARDSEDLLQSVDRMGPDKFTTASSSGCFLTQQCSTPGLTQVENQSAAAGQSLTECFYQTLGFTGSSWAVGCFWSWSSKKSSWFCSLLYACQIINAQLVIIGGMNDFHYQWI